MNKHFIEYIAPELLKPRARAWRKVNPKQLETACRLISKDGIIEPPLVAFDNSVVCGNVTHQAALKLELASIPILRVNDLSPEELRLYAINAHKLTDMGSYDDMLLAEELRELEELLGPGSLDNLAIEEGELDRLLALLEAEERANEDDHLDIEGSSVTRLGDLWQIGPHRWLCGSSLEALSFHQLMGQEMAQFGLTDPPYNIAMRIISTDRTREEFAQAHGEMSANEYTRFCTTFMKLMKMHSEPGSVHAFFMSYHYLLELLRAGTIVFGRPKAMCTWVKSQPGQGGLFRSQTEHIVYLKNGEAPHRNNVQLGKHGRNRTTAWHYDGMTTPSAERDELLKLHATPKPVLMLKDAILDVTSRGGIVLDPFGGIGSTLLAAHSAERRAYLIEIEPKYLDAGIRRMRASHGIDAVRLSDGALFSELETQRERVG